MKYCNSLTKYSRLETREVFIGGIPLGGKNPIRVQSMTTTDTMNTIATVEQSIRMVQAGCEYVRITAPSIKEAQNLLEIKKELKKRGYEVPLIADIHFTPNAAELAARIVEKVRINPGNYIDKKKFDIIEYTDAEYEAEIERIRKRFTPLVKICKEYGTAMRIGTNHGSLSDRIMSRYGDSPLGMVESALEFLRICREEDFHNIVLSMKSSNPKVMIEAYRLLIYRMGIERMDYPLHLGVTEAGGGEDARIKSALGIGALLEDGIGDTIRVSLTEDPEFEIPVALSLVNRYKHRENSEPAIPEIAVSPINPFEYQRRITNSVIEIGENNVPCVIADLSRVKNIKYNDLSNLGFFYNLITDKWVLSDSSPDFIYVGQNEISTNLPLSLGVVYDYQNTSIKDIQNKLIPYFPSFSEYISNISKFKNEVMVKINYSDLDSTFLEKIKGESKVLLVFDDTNPNYMATIRSMFFNLLENKILNPVIIKRTISEVTKEEFSLFASTDVGGLFIDGFGDGIWVSSEELAIEDINRIAFGILQATRLRISKTEYIACPSCGRTLFDLQETTDMIRRQTEHLKGVKIAVMGCIVNGPGEMADADYGYVGSGVDKITLYRGKEIVKRNIDYKEAVGELIGLIKEDGRWVEKI